MRTLLSSLTLMSCLAGCTGVHAPADPADVTVELDAFSGRPNPEWTLSVEEASTLAARLAEAEPRPRAPVPAQPLGFRGYGIANPGGDGGISEVLYVTAEGQLVDSGTNTVFADAPAATAYLREIARARGFGEIVR